MSPSQELLERELGKAVYNMLGDKAVLEAASLAARCTAVQVLEEIKAALSNPSWGDFDYVETIVDIFHHYGISCNCHDF